MVRVWVSPGVRVGVRVGVDDGVTAVGVAEGVIFVAVGVQVGVGDGTSAVGVVEGAILVAAGVRVGVLLGVGAGLAPPPKTSLPRTMSAANPMRAPTGHTRAKPGLVLDPGGCDVAAGGVGAPEETGCNADGLGDEGMDTPNASAQDSTAHQESPTEKAQLSCKRFVSRVKSIMGGMWLCC
jgi:hypothetical protein